MKRVRVIPVLLVQDGGLVKGTGFKNYKYVGDPINAVKIFNEKEVDELVVLDISATAENRGPRIEYIRDIISEAFMPVAYGGGITSMEQINMLIKAGCEKVVLNTAAYAQPELITAAAARIGSQSVVASMDVSKSWLGKYKVYVQNGSKSIGTDPVAYAKQLEKLGAGEIFLQSIDRDGSFSGYDNELVAQVSKAVSIPIVAMGGAGSVEDFASACKAGASAVAAGSMFVFQRPHKAVLITYPSQQDLKEKVFLKL